MMMMLFRGCWCITRGSLTLRVIDRWDDFGSHYKRRRSRVQIMFFFAPECLVHFHNSTSTIVTKGNCSSSSLVHAKDPSFVKWNNLNC